VVALPHPAWVEYKKRTGRAITDSLAVEIAGHYLQAALAAGEGWAARCTRLRSRKLYLIWKPWFPRCNAPLPLKNVREALGRLRLRERLRWYT